jgi:three-Cys-motif partner protein
MVDPDSNPGASMASDFFDTRQAAAVLKHGVLQRYLPVFIGKTGSRSLGKRVVYIDGYAGPGMYQDGTPGSPELALQTAIKLAGMREVDCFFVERDRSSYETLRAHLEEPAMAGGLLTVAESKTTSTRCWQELQDCRSSRSWTRSAWSCRSTC